MQTIPDEAKECWKAILKSVDLAYAQYQKATHIGKLQVRPVPEEKPQWVRLRNLIGPQLRGALSSDFQQELTTEGKMNPEDALFQLYTLCELGDNMSVLPS